MNRNLKWVLVILSAFIFSLTNFYFKIVASGFESAAIAGIIAVLVYYLLSLIKTK